MTLAEWVTAEGGSKIVATKLGVSEETVLFWLKRRGTPKVSSIVKIIQISRGKLSFQDIISSCKPREKRK